MFRRWLPAWMAASEPTSMEEANRAGSRGGGGSRRRGRRSSPSDPGSGDPGSGDATSPDNGDDELEPELELIHLRVEQKAILKSTWQIIYSRMGHALCYVGGADNRGGVAETFVRLFEEYPRSKEFFIHFKGTPIEKLQSDPKLMKALEEHSVRVMQVVEKVIGRLEDLNKSKEYLLKLGKFHRLSGIPSDFFGVMGVIFVHAVRPFLEEEKAWNEETEDVWLELFGHIARVMTHGHCYSHLQKRPKNAITEA